MDPPQLLLVFSEQQNIESVVTGRAPKQLARAVFRTRCNMGSMVTSLPRITKRNKKKRNHGENKYLAYIYKNNKTEKMHQVVRVLKKTVQRAGIIYCFYLRLRRSFFVLVFFVVEHTYSSITSRCDILNFSPFFFSRAPSKLLRSIMGDHS